MEKNYIVNDGLKKLVNDLLILYYFGENPEDVLIKYKKDYRKIPNISKEDYFNAKNFLIDILKKDYVFDLKECNLR